MTPEQTAPESLHYLNAYEVTLGYGGPEEGGWWYDIGTPLASVPVRTAADEDAARASLHQMLDPEFAGRPRKSSTADDAADLIIVSEDAVAVAFPEIRPHYE
jgi:hypothetical protein